MYRESVLDDVFRAAFSYYTVGALEVIQREYSQLFTADQVEFLLAVF